MTVDQPYLLACSLQWLDGGEVPRLSITSSVLSDSMIVKTEMIKNG